MKNYVSMLALHFEASMYTEISAKYSNIEGQKVKYLYT